MALKAVFFFSRDGVLFGVGLAIRSAKRYDLVKVGSRIQIQLKTRSLRIQLKLHWSQKRSKILALWGSFASASYKNKLWIIRNKVVSGIGRKIMETSWFFAYGSTFWFWFSIFSRLWAIFWQLRLRLRFRNFISVALWTVQLRKTISNTPCFFIVFVESIFLRPGLEEESWPVSEAFDRLNKLWNNLVPRVSHTPSGAGGKQDDERPWEWGSL